MNKIYTTWSILCFILFCTFSSSLIGQSTVVSHNFDSGTDGWTVGSGWINDATSFTGNSTGHFHTTPFNDYPSSSNFTVTSSPIDLSNYSALTLSIMIRYNTESSWDGMNVEYSTDGTNWTVLGAQGAGSNWYNDSDVDGIGDNVSGWSGDNGSWQTATIPLPAALEMTANVQFRFNFGSDGSTNDDGVAFDDFLITGTSACTAPTATFTLVPDCANAQFSVNVDVTALGDGTAVDITNDGGVAAITNVTAGMQTVGPFAAGASTIITVDGMNYGGCSVVSMAQTEACNCTTNPAATVASANLNCTTGMYDIQVTVTSDGSGDANMTDILIDGATVQTNATTNTLYTFSVTTGMHAVQIQAEGASFVTCEADYMTNETCNGGDVCADAVDILGTSAACDLTTATLDAPANILDCFLNVGANSLGRGTCAGASCSENSAYWYTDYKDIWYVINLASGTDEFSVSFTNLTCNVAVVPYTGVCGSLSPMDVGQQGMADADNNGVIETEAGDMPFIGTDGVIHFKGDEVDNASGSPIYLRVFAHDNRAAGTACNDADIAKCAFDIAVSAPQANDICGGGLQINSYDDDVINDPDSHLPVTQSGDISQASTDAETASDVNGTSCNGTTMATGEEDLWYNFKTPATGKYYLELDIDFTGPEDELYIVLYDECFSGDVIGCQTISSDGTLLFDADDITQFGNVLDEDDVYNVRVVLPTGSTATTFDISAKVVSINNTCLGSDLLLTSGDFDVTSNQELNFNFASDSGIEAGVAGNDLWFHFEPETDILSAIGNDPADNPRTGSTSADVLIQGLDTGEEVTLILYKRDCSNLTADSLATFSGVGNGTIEITCLDEQELGLGTTDSYYIRVIQTAGSTIDGGSIRVDPDAVPGPPNNDCENLTLSNLDNYFILGSGYSNFVTGTFQSATDCHPDITSADCDDTDDMVDNPTDYHASATNEDRDAWFVFRAPSSPNPCNDLTTSEQVNSVKFLFNSGNADRDGILYLYTSCGDAGYVRCSGSLDGSPSGAGDDQFNDAQSTWVVSDLVPNQYYYLRVKPDDSNINGLANEFTFDVSYEQADFTPCNDEPDNAPNLPIDSDGLDRAACQATTPYSAQGATTTSGQSSGNDVWFTFTAPDNGGPYVLDEGWLTVWLQGVSAGHALTMEAYNQVMISDGMGGMMPAVGAKISGTTNAATGFAGDEDYMNIGHLTNGATYYVRLYHSEIATENVQYRICAYYNTGFGDCPMNVGTPPNLVGLECANDCSTFFQIDLPEETPSGFYRIEVMGNNEDLDFRVRAQGMDNPSNEGNVTDIDHPCNAAGNITIEDSSTAPADGACGTGTGFVKIYNLIGPVTGDRNYYYLEVYDDTDVVGCDGLDICKVEVKGPFLTEADAINNGAPNGECAPCTISSVAVNTDGACVGDNATFSIDFNIISGSGDYEIYATAANATYGISVGDVLGTITGAATDGTGLTVSGQVNAPNAAGTISVDIRDTNDNLCNGGSGITVNIPACVACAAENGIFDASSFTAANAVGCGGSGTFDISAIWTSPNAAFTQEYIVVDASGNIQQIAASTSLTVAAAGTYTIYAINYDPGDAPTGLTVGQPFANLTGGCFDTDAAAATPETLTINIYDAITITPAASSETCSADGTTYSYDFTVTNGSGTYSSVTSTDGYTITDNGGGSYTVSGIPSSMTTSISVTDSAGCTIAAAVTIPATGINCCGASIGSFPGN